MVKESWYTRALRQAVQQLGSRQRLAEHLGARDSELIAWLRGDRIPPQAVVDSLQALLGTQAPAA